MVLLVRLITTMLDLDGTDMNDREWKNYQHEGSYEGVRCKGLRTSLREIL